MQENVDVRFVFTPPADHAAGLLTLPWSAPLESWQDDRLVQIPQRGLSRHVVRFVYEDGTLYALKELSERLARREFRLLRAMADLNIPAVEAIGIAVDLDEAKPRRQDSDELGFDADEVELIPAPEGNKLRVRTRVAETGHFAQQLFL